MTGDIATLTAVAGACRMHLSRAGIPNLDAARQHRPQNSLNPAMLGNAGPTAPGCGRIATDRILR